jgi:hypothetical protein
MGALLSSQLQQPDADASKIARVIPTRRWPANLEQGEIPNVGFNVLRGAAEVMLRQDRWLKQWQKRPFLTRGSPRAYTSPAV